MTTRGEAEIIAAIRDRLVRALGPRKIILFGSRARGDARPDSDYDILVVHDGAGTMTDRSVAARAAIADIPVGKDVLVLTAAEYARYRTWLSHVARIADEEGRVLYEAA